MTGLAVRILSNSLALFIATKFVDGFTVLGSWREFLLAGTVLAILNLLVKPVLKALAFPLIVITLGLFALVINAGLLWSLTYLFSFIIIQGLMPLIVATLIVTIVNTILARTT